MLTQPYLDYIASETHKSGSIERVYAVERDGTLIGHIYMLGHPVDDRPIIKVSGNPVKTMAIFATLRLFVTGELPTISLDIESNISTLYST